MTFEFSRRPQAALLDIKGRRPAVGELLGSFGLKLPEQSNSTSSFGEMTSYRVAPCHWLLRAPLRVEDQLLREIKPASQRPDILIELVSDLWVFYRLSGSGMNDALAVATSLDFEELKEDAATFTEVFGERALLIQQSNHWELAFENSLTAMMEDYFSRIAGYAALDSEV